MKTPICDFVRQYAKDAPRRMHMPGHKGIPLLGPEPLDITEIDGADSLYEASGVIRESEQNASGLFGSADTLYSTEGSSQCIRAMLYLTLIHAKKQGRKPTVLATRNAHKTFVTAAGLLDMDMDWLTPSADTSYLSCQIDPKELEARLSQSAPTALYVTSPDYLGTCAELSVLADICHRYGVLLLVDNAHGAYLKFLSPSRHPLDAGADLCCDSAHKTLPALTGAAYLHIGKNAPTWMCEAARGALAVFGSTSPSYLILQSLDAVNAYLDGGYRERLACFAASVFRIKERLSQYGYTLVGDEPMKITLSTKPYGYTGREIAELLSHNSIVCEFSDADFVTVMLSCETGEADLAALEAALKQIPSRPALTDPPPRAHLPQRVLSIREAMLADRERIPTEQAEGRVLATLNVSCPPAIPIAVCGERIDREVIARFNYYGIAFCDVVSEP